MKAKIILLLDNTTQDEVDEIASNLRDKYGDNVIAETEVPQDDGDFLEHKEYTNR